MSKRIPFGRVKLDGGNDFLAKTNLGVAVAALFLLSPFAVNHLINGRLFMGAGAAAIVAILTVNAWSILRGRMVSWLTPIALVPAITAYLVVCFRQQGAIAAFWSYPALISFYFMLSPRQARIANLVLLAVIIPEASSVLPPALTIRFAATLLAVSIFSTIFVCILSRQRYLLRKMAVTDQLTGLLNRKTLDPSLDRAVQQSRRTGTPMTLIALDLDNFKSVNDTFGHEAGDKVLHAVGSTLRERLRGSDQVFRLGGEEFLALLFDTDSDHGNLIAEELRTSIAALDILPTRKITVSLGLAGLRPDETWKDWWKRADDNLYRAKSAGRNRIVASSK
ncbi:MAG: GGDEF domain-containing protein [bacterium]|nr:GGDEF domain-containing protein [bacterium]